MTELKQSNSEPFTGWRLALIWSVLFTIGVAATVGLIGILVAIKDAL
jgi:hypothetical protein